MHRGLATILLLTASAPVLAAQAANRVVPSCSTHVTVQEAVEQASLILTGRVLQTSDYNQRMIVGTSRSSWRMHQVVLLVLRGWKGQPRDTIIFSTLPPDQDSGVTRFELNRVYLVYLSSPFDQAALRDTANLAVMSLLRDHPQFIRCSRTKALGAASDDLHFLGPPLWTRQ